jgi:class 3 adenylate cyclase
VLFLDIVGYSKLSVNEQHARVNELNEIVRLCEQFRKAEAASRLLKIPTGDGMALVFYKSPEEPAQCAVEISRALKDNARLQVRMGIHSGPVSGVVDVNERTNVAGAGVNMARRVMDCGDARHILLSRHVAEDLAEYERWRRFLHDIGTFEVKHGMRVSVTNLYSDEVGNAKLPSKLQAVRKHRAHVRWAEIGAALLVLGAIIGAFFLLHRSTRARPQLCPTKARRALCNDPRLFELTSHILGRRGQQEEGLQNLQRAVELDPRNFEFLQQIALSYLYLGRNAESIAALDRAVAILPDNAETRAVRGVVYLCWKADTRPLHQTIDSILAQGPGAIASAASYWFFCALAERDPVAAERALVAAGDNPCWMEAPIYLSRSFGEGLLARMTKDEARARTAFESARAQQENIVQAQPDYGPALYVLGLIDAALGRKDLALEEGRRAIALTPVEKDFFNRILLLQYFAITAAWAGDKELALQQLEAGLRAPVASYALSYGALKLHPFWDPLRGDPRFEKIVASLAPKEASK